MKKQTTKLQIQEQILKFFKENDYQFNGKIPLKISDIPHKYIIPSYFDEVKDEDGNIELVRVKNEYWTKARTKLHNDMRPRKTDVRWKNKHHKKVRTPLMLAETPKANPMKGYRQVARTGRVNENTFTNLVKDYSQEFKIDSMSLTNEGTLVVQWKEVKS